MSKQILLETGVSKPRIIVTADPAFSLEGMDKDEGRRILRELKIPKNKKLLGISVRKWNESGRDFESIMARICDYASEKYDMYPVFIPMQPEKDMQISRNIMSKMKSPSSVIEDRQTVNGMMSVVGCMDMCIGMRLHSLIYAAIGAVPLIGIVYDPKITSFLDYTHQKNCIDAGKMTEDELKKAIDKCIANHDNIVSDLEKNYEQLKIK